METYLVLFFYCLPVLITGSSLSLGLHTMAAQREDRALRRYFHENKFYLIAGVFIAAVLPGVNFVSTVFLTPRLLRDFSEYRRQERLRARLPKQVEDVFAQTFKRRGPDLALKEFQHDVKETIRGSLLELQAIERSRRQLNAKQVKDLNSEDLEQSRMKSMSN